MTRKIYRTAQGRTVDLGALQLKNEGVRAVGNMSVNARGDLIDGWNRPINTRNQEVAKQYRKQTNVSDTPVLTTAAADPKPSKKSKTRAPEVVVPPAPEDFQDDFVKPETANPAPAGNNTAGGLAAAIARARQIKQEPLLTTQQIAQQTPGVRKI